MKLAGYERYVVAPTCLMQNFRKLHSCFLHQHSQIRFTFLVQGHSERHIKELLSSSTLRLHRIKYCLEQQNQEYLKNIRKKRRGPFVCWRWEKEKKCEAAGQSVQTGPGEKPWCCLSMKKKAGEAPTGTQFVPLLCVEAAEGENMRCWQSRKGISIS